MATWAEALKAAILRHVSATGSVEFTRPDFIAAELDALVAATGTTGLTPSQTLGREMQELRDAGLVAFDRRGVYRWLGEMPQAEPVSPSNAIFMHSDRAPLDAPLAQRFAFAPQWLPEARRTAGEWIVYQNANGFRAAARVDRIEPGSGGRAASAIMAEDSYLEFGQVVPIAPGGRFIEAALGRATDRTGAELAARPVRTLPRDEFDRIIDLGLIGDDDLLPRRDADAQLPSAFAEQRSAYDAYVDRATVLSSRKVRDRQFRKRVLQAYGSSCALTGMKLINGGGRAETEAAHIMSVEAGGPDAIENGIALSGTVHWMFDRGLISLSDTGEILLSRAINDRAGVERLIHRDRRARFPIEARDRPHPRYLAWHRAECFHH